MSAPTLSPPASSSPEAAHVAKPPRRRLGGQSVLFIYTWLVIIWLIIPIVVMIAFGFNDTKGRYNQSWEGFTFKWYHPAKLFEIGELTNALWTSLVIAVISSVLAAALGTGIGYALGRYRFHGSGTLNLIMFSTISSPELIMGASLLSFFVSAGLGLGAVTITIAHVMFSLSFVAIIVRARVITLDRSIEEAAADLGASAWVTFWKVTFPIILPAVFSGLLLAFALSIDDFVVTNFTAGSEVTFPLWIWGSTRVGLPPQVNVMGTLIFGVGVLIAIASNIRSRKANKS
ncbi:ABC transporter permease [Actinoplanes sp. NPDC026619]|uniref:ABC transporter permease n=1 Tax=Actinoplanes sp. NPDC026619 TaxID=3155798 RepID=UPI00340B1DF4